MYGVAQNLRVLKQAKIENTAPEGYDILMGLNGTSCESLKLSPEESEHVAWTWRVLKLIDTYYTGIM